MIHFEKELSRKELYRGHIVDFCLHQVELENGKTACREIVHHHGGVSVAALDPQGRLLLVRQFRFAAGKELLELPAGKLERGEDPMAAAARELEEETGYQAQSLELLTEMIPTPGYCTEVIRIYLAKGLRPGRQHLDPEEFLSVEAMDFAKAKELALAGGFPDGKTQLGILLLAARLEREKASERDER